MKFYKEKTSNLNFSKKRSQNFLIFAYVVGNYLNFWILAVSTSVHFVFLSDSSQTMCIIPYVPPSLGQLLGVITPIIGQILTPGLFSWVTMGIKTGLELIEGEIFKKNINEIFHFDIFSILPLKS